MTDRKEVYEVIVELNRRRNELLEQCCEAEPESVAQPVLDGHVHGLKEALDALGIDVDVPALRARGMGDRRSVTASDGRRFPTCVGHRSPSRRRPVPPSS